MGELAHFSRRSFTFAAVTALTTGCSSLSVLNGKARADRGPRETLDDYFALLTAKRYDQASNLLSRSFRSRLGPAGVDSLLHAFRSAQVVDLIDAVTWANRLGAQLSAPASDRREYLVTLQIQPSESGSRTWPTGVARRFIDLLWQDQMWKIDAIGMSPGVVVTGLQPVAPSTYTNATGNAAVVIPTEPLRIGQIPVDRAIYTARQNAVERGLIPWATDPIEVVRHDGSSFGLQPSDAARLAGQDVDPTTLVPRAKVTVEQGGQALVVTLIQPIQTGPKGVWAISEILPSV